eukprot:TRINITY_DN240_c0_g1_i1.p1 TRINITY_DN240_c0_g1~~TRINITY_DN240_c0_g1_i1.p1  ORF type:complete len:227 (-),score=26.91 TRINITY_DN240_c0_g1_i1:38-718(-)
MGGLSNNNPNMAEKKPTYTKKITKVQPKGKRSWGTIYLIAYNAFQTLAWTSIFLLTAISIFKGENIWDNVGNLCMYAQFVGLLEALHGLFGLTRTSIFASVLQQSGRVFYLFVAVEPNEIIHNHFAVWHVFLAWSITEIIRYPFYLFKLYRPRVPEILQWLRYNAFIVLYPWGLFGEWYTMRSVLEFLDSESQSYQFINVVSYILPFAVLYLYITMFSMRSKLYKS